MGLNLPGTGTFIFLGCICAAVGWGVIEFILWLFSFIHISIA
ncbi:putative membrane protein [Yersinia enterocolitica]|nr:hypothetical protein [Yersinia enterocolitica]AJI81260.1 putative membrane protein [Yersinia enterocolitica]KGA68945.1 putative membrane protein [Yersinia enterocolitica]KGA76338.1 putative membrane protein [Yersinia enterocolitica]CNK12204.1 Uncharacterised protein [Yersinia enterocolitica]CRY19638.1 Uncharacterised protein [Yersinia enterocolitica]